MSHRGDFALGSTVDLKFTTRQFSTGAPFTLAGSPVIAAYPDNSTTQLTAGITLTVDFDSVTGLNHVRIVASGGNGYASGSTYDLVITTGTVNSVSVVGEVIGSFSLELSSALRPTTAGRTLDVSATGEGGVDWGNVGSPTTTVDLSGTTIKTTQKVDVDTIKTNPVVNGGTITFPTTAILASTTNITGGTITTATNVTTVNGLAAGVITAAAIATDAIGSDELAASAITEIQAGLSTLDAAGVRSAVGLASANLDTQLSTIAGYVDTEVAAIKAKTDSLTFTMAGAVDANVQRINDVTITGDGSASPFGV